MVYFPLISLKLTNTVDGLWTTAEYMAGAWELSNGRWFWLVTSFLRFSLQLEPINAVVCLVLVSLGVTKLHMTFKTVHEGRTSCLDWLAGLCYLANTVIGCYLSFAHQSVEFGLAFYLSVLAAVCVIRSRSIAAGIAQGAFLLALSLGLYQTDLACFCMVLLAWFLVLLFRGEEGIKLRYYIAKCLGSAVCGVHFTAGEYSFVNTNADEWENTEKPMACQCSTKSLLKWYRARKGLSADAPMNGKLFFDAANAAEPEALEVLERFCKMVAVQIYNLTVLLDVEKVAIGGGISKQPLLLESLRSAYDGLYASRAGQAYMEGLPRCQIVP
ncbi:hypothetical protein CGS55_16625, partial [Faecalibacterium prausnitzii]